MEFQRFYALGIDAYRIAQELLNPRPEHSPLDGVTGFITSTGSGAWCGS